MMRRVAIVGAGLAGAACARRLIESGFDVEVIEASPDVGGRMAGEEADTAAGPARADLGVPYLTSRSDAFTAQLRRWVAAGVAEPWSARIVTIDERGQERPSSALAWIGRPDMGAIVAHDLSRATVRRGARVAAILGEPGFWRVALEDGTERGFYRAVVVAAPAEPASAVLDAPAPCQASAARRVLTTSSWAVAAAFETRVATPYDGATLQRGPLAWICRESAKPGRRGPETWTIHAAPGWSYDHEALAPADAAARLVEEFRRRTDAPAPIWSTARLWRHAVVERPVGAPFGWDAAALVGSCGDWYLGSRPELAWRSGAELASTIAADLAEDGLTALAS